MKLPLSMLIESIKRNSFEDLDEVLPTSKISDLDIDSLGIVEIIFELEEELKVEIPFNSHSDTIGKDATVKDLYILINEIIT